MDSAAATGRAFVTFSRTIPGDRTTAGRLSILIGKGPSATATGWSFSVVSTSPQQITGCNASFQKACFFRGSATQIDPVVGGAWGFSQLFSGTGQFDWLSKAVHVN